MSALISTGFHSMGGGMVQTVNARDLHEFLGVGKDFSTWIKDRIAQYDFDEGVDFVTHQDLRSPNSGSAKSRAVMAIEYAISLDMAKELAMVERTDKGKEARQYFIECERRLKSQPSFDPSAVLSDPAAMRGLLLSYTEKVMTLQAENAELQEDRATLDRISKADGSLCITDAAKALQIRPKDLFSWLRGNGWIYRRAGSAYDLGYQAKILTGDMEHKVTTVLRGDGTEKLTEQVRITPKGLAKLAKLIRPAISA